MWIKLVLWARGGEQLKTSLKTSVLEVYDTTVCDSEHIITPPFLFLFLLQTIIFIEREKCK